MRGLDVSDPEWGIRISEYGNGVLNESLPIYYQSEKPELSDRDGLIIRLVGSTFESFLDENETDIVVLFYAAPQPENLSAEFEEAVTTVYKGGTRTIKFGQINVWKNACQRRFPPLLSNPLIVMFPAGDGSVAIPYLGQLKPVPILRFLKARASKPHKIEVEPITIEEAKIERQVLEQGYQGLPEWAAGFAKEEIYNLEVLINASVSVNTQKSKVEQSQTAKTSQN
jgi:hypothetical protein